VENNFSTALTGQSTHEDSVQKSGLRRICLIRLACGKFYFKKNGHPTCIDFLTPYTPAPCDRAYIIEKERERERERKEERERVSERVWERER